MANFVAGNVAGGISAALLNPMQGNSSLLGPHPHWASRALCRCCCLLSMGELVDGDVAVGQHVAVAGLQLRRARLRGRQAWLQLHSCARSRFRVRGAAPRRGVR